MKRRLRQTIRSQSLNGAETSRDSRAVMPNLPSGLLGNLARISYAPLRSPTTEALPLNAGSIPRTEHAMSKVVAIMSMSLDGYVADGNDGVAEVFVGNPTVIQG